MSLVLHTGGVQTTVEQLDRIHTPKPTETWHPIPHKMLLDETRSSLDRIGFTVASEEHAVWRGGDRYFGLLNISHAKNDKYNMIVGLRNSHDQKFSAGLVLGSRVFVCDNLAFSGEVRIARKHTRFIRKALPELVYKCVHRLSAMKNHQDFRIGKYREASISDTEVNNMLISSFDNGVIPSNQIGLVLHEYRNPMPEYQKEHGYIPEDLQRKTVWRFLNALTRVITPKVNTEDLALRTIKLHSLLDSFCGIQAMAV